jgi:hypothetical protein
MLWLAQTSGIGLWLHSCFTLALVRVSIQHHAAGALPRQRAVYSFCNNHAVRVNTVLYIIMIQ